MLFKTVRRKDPIELNYNLYEHNKEIKLLKIQIGSLVGATIF